MTLQLKGSAPASGALVGALADYIELLQSKACHA